MPADPFDMYSIGAKGPTEMGKVINGTPGHPERLRSGGAVTLVELYALRQFPKQRPGMLF